MSCCWVWRSWSFISCWCCHSSRRSRPARWHSTAVTARAALVPRDGTALLCHLVLVLCFLVLALFQLLYHLLNFLYHLQKFGEDLLN